MSDVTLKGRGTTLEVWDTDATPDAWVQISQVYSISGGELGREDGEDADSFLDSASLTADFRKRGAGQKVLGDIEIEAAWEVTQDSTKGHKLLRDLYMTSAERHFRVTYPNVEETAEIYHAFVHAIGEKNVEPDQTIRLPFTLRPTGKFYQIDDGLDETAFLPPVTP